MEKYKFWLIQLVMVAFVSLILGSPVLADDDDDDDDRRSNQQWNHGGDDDDDDNVFNDDRWHDRYNAKLARKTAKFENKMDNASDKRYGKLEKRFARMQDRFAAKLVRHELKYPEYHASTVLDLGPDCDPAVMFEEASFVDGVLVFTLVCP